MKKPTKKEPSFDANFRQWTRGVSFSLTMGKLQVALLVAIHASKGWRNHVDGIWYPHAGINSRRLQNWVIGARALESRGLVRHWLVQDPKAKKRFGVPIPGSIAKELRADVFASNEEGRGNYHVTEAGEAVVRAAILHIAKTAQAFTSEGVVAILPADAAKGLERFPNVTGACFRAEAKAGTIQLTGAYQAARRPEARKRRLAVWKAP